MGIEFNKDEALSAMREKARHERFIRSPFWYTVHSVSREVLKVFFWLCLWALIAQCECKGCIW